MEKVKTWNFNSRELLEILRSFIETGLCKKIIFFLMKIADINHYEMLSVEIAKRIDSYQENEFLEAYYNLALSGIKSQALALTVSKKLRECLDAISECIF